MKFGPITKLDKINKIAWKKIADYFMPDNCEVIIVFPIFGQFGAIRKLDSEGTELKNTTLALLLWVKVLFLPKNADFLSKMLTSTELRGSWY